MGHDEAVVTQNSGKAPSPAKDQPAIYPYVDWSAIQSYYGPGILPPTFFAPGIAPGHALLPYIWGPQNLPPAAFGNAYAAIYPHGGGFLPPFVPLMVNPLNAEPTKSVNSKENILNKKLKEIDGTAVSTGTGSGNSEKTSGDYSLDGSSDDSNHKVSRTPKKRSLDDRTTSGAETCVVSPASDIQGEPGRSASLANVCILDTVIKPCASADNDLKVVGVPSTELATKDDKESKRERRKQSNRQSARRSRLRKQAETEELARKVELLTAENTSLLSEINRVTENSQKLRLENSALMDKLAKAASDQARGASAGPTTAAAAAPPARVVKNFLSIMDGAGASRRSSRHMEHGAPRLLGSGPLAADAVAAS